MRFAFYITLLVISGIFLTSCAPKHSDIIIAKYSDDAITLGEFENAYAKNAGSIDLAKKDSLPKLKNFLDLYVNFKMKLRDAKVKGFDNDEALNAELKDYKEKVGSTYLIEKKIVEPGIKKLYDQRKYELRVAHLWIKVDSLGDEKAKTFTQSLIDSINNGKKFEDMVLKYSADQYSRKTGGDIYYITAGNVVPEFEDAAYATEVGKIYPYPVKTKFGYHIIKVNEKKERIPQVRASHLLIDFRIDSTRVDSVEARKQIEDIKNQIAKGADFTEMVKKYSEDPSTKENGGDLGFFERRMMVKEFDEVAFNLKKGEVSNVIKTQFGYHLIKLTDMKPLPSYEEDKENLKRIFKRSRYDIAYNDLVGGLKTKYNFKFNNNVVASIIKQNDSTKFGTDYWSKEWRKSLKDSVIYSINNVNVSVDTLFSRAEKSSEFNNKLVTEKLLNTAVNKDGENTALNLEAGVLEKTDEQFAALMDDYRNGIYIFKLQDDEIWSKVKVDSADLVKFYDANKEKYSWPDRVKFQEIFSRKDSLINVYYNRLQKGESFDSLAAKYTERTGYKEKAGMYEFTDLSNPLAQEAQKLKTGSFSEPIKSGNGFSIVRLIASDPARLKTFEEAKAEVSGQYQESESKRLESEYVGKLKNLYKPEIFYEKLDQAFKSN